MLRASSYDMGTTATVPFIVPVVESGYWDAIGFGEDSLPDPESPSRMLDGVGVAYTREEKRHVKARFAERMAEEIDDKTS